MADERDRREQRDGANEAQRRDEEICRMAAFRVREAANRIAALAHSAERESLRNELIALCERLLKEEREVLTGLRGR